MIGDRLLAGPELSYTSAQTMLNILHSRGKVKRVVKNMVYCYEPAVSHPRAAAKAVQRPAPVPLERRLDMLVILLLWLSRPVVLSYLVAAPPQPSGSP